MSQGPDVQSCTITSYVWPDPSATGHRGSFPLRKLSLLGFGVLLWQKAADPPYTCQPATGFLCPTRSLRHQGHALDLREHARARLQLQLRHRFMSDAREQRRAVDR